jgi:hypothetical protein
MRPIQHPSNNDVLRAPPGVPIEECTPLPITRVIYQGGTNGVWSYWQPSAEELALLKAGKHLRVEIIGGTQPPLSIGVDGDGRP